MTTISFQIVDISSDDWINERVEYLKDKKGNFKIDEKGNHKKVMNKNKHFIITL